MSYRHQTLTTDQLDAVCRLWQDAAVYDPCSRQLLVEKIFADQDISDDMRTVVMHDDEPVGLIVGVVRRPVSADRAAAPAGYLKMIAVAPDQRRQRIGSRLLDDLESRLRRRGVTHCRFAESAPNYLTPGLDQRNTETRAFLVAAGYEPIGVTHNQRVALRDQTFRRTAGRDQDSGVTIRRATASDRRRLASLLATEWPAWQAEADRALANQPPTLYLALDGDDVIAFAAYDANNLGTGWFGPMGTLPAARGRGIGRVLLHNCLADMQDQGLGEATIPWVGPLGFYEQHAGAQVSRTFDRFEKLL